MKVIKGLMLSLYQILCCLTFDNYSYFFKTLVWRTHGISCDHRVTWDTWISCTGQINSRHSEFIRCPFKDVFHCILCVCGEKKGRHDLFYFFHLNIHSFILIQNLYPTIIFLLIILGSRLLLLQARTKLWKHTGVLLQKIWPFVELFLLNSL